MHNFYARHSTGQLREMADHALHMAHIADKDGSGNPSTAYDRWAKEWALLTAELETRAAPEISALDKELRIAGFTSAAKNFPLSETGFRWICKFNGVPPEKAPRAWRYAPNQYMLEYVERKATEDREHFAEID